MNPLVRRTVLTEQTRTKFFGRPFKWGSCDCAKIAAFHARKFGWKVPKTGGYSSLLGAQRRLEELGAESLPALLDALGMEEIAPARVLTGDLVSFASDATIGALGVVLGGGTMLAFHEVATGAAVIRMDAIERAWSVWKEHG